MFKDYYLRSELKEKFLRDFIISEKIFFLKKVEESIFQKGYPACEDLYHYCYFSTLKQRLLGIRSAGANGINKFLCVYGIKELDDTIKLYEERLAGRRKIAPDTLEYKFLEYFSKLL